MLEPSSLLSLLWRCTARNTHVGYTLTGLSRSKLTRVALGWALSTWGRISLWGTALWGRDARLP
jgi:hypothetical protein